MPRQAAERRNRRTGVLRRGYSGKNTNRPDFQRLMADVESGRVSKIIVYKLDRMSRSVLDFELTYRELKRHHVDFVSATEDFDTTSITGEAVLRGDTHIRAAGA